MRLWIGLSAFSVMLAALPASAEAQTLPNAVRAYVTDIEAYCTGGVATGAKVSTATFSDDGKADYVVDKGAVRCRDEDLPPYCGATGFCSFHVFVSGKRGYSDFDFLARRYRVGKGSITVDGKRLRWNGKAFAEN